MPKVSHIKSVSDETSLTRWNKLYDGTRESLMPKSHRPHTPHPKSHTEEN
ncbi:MAG: hypothetical protein LUG99_16285 [Lachnospiraceae bacterium]|nr:hypothetical protein [Lachnospiraceae bacterium]